LRSENRSAVAAFLTDIHFGGGSISAPAVSPVVIPAGIVLAAGAAVAVLAFPDRRFERAGEWLLAVLLAPYCTAA
jgi:hypothetical protein